MYPAMTDEERKETINRHYNAIMAYMGGKGFLAMIGARLPLTYTYHSNDDTFILTIHFKAKASNHSNMVSITYKHVPDLYYMEFQRVYNYKLTVISKHEDLYADMLEATFNKETGLATRMFQKGNIS